jgi:hypothetical protein
LARHGAGRRVEKRDFLPQSLTDKVDAHLLDGTNSGDGDEDLEG